MNVVVEVVVAVVVEVVCSKRIKRIPAELIE
jgi:hypothetical protein